jgi:hypothetical protein
VQTAGKARLVAQHQAIELLEKLEKVNFCCSVIALSGSALPGKSLLMYCLEYHICASHALFKKLNIGFDILRYLCGMIVNTVSTSTRASTRQSH